MTVLIREHAQTLVLENPRAPSLESAARDAVEERIHWCRFPHVTQSPTAQVWLTHHSARGRSEKTLDGYARGLEVYLAFCIQQGIIPEYAGKEHLAAYARYLVHQATFSPDGQLVDSEGQQSPHQRMTAFGTQRLRLTAVRLYFDALQRAHIRPDNPLRYRSISLHSWLSGDPLREEGHCLPDPQSTCGHPCSQQQWCPSDEQWNALLQVLQREPLRNQVMFALAAEAGLRCAELCQIIIGDLYLPQRLVSVTRRGTPPHFVASAGSLQSAPCDQIGKPREPGEQTKCARPISTETADLCARYLDELHTEQGPCRLAEPLFRSESWRSRRQPVSPTTWSKVLQRLSARSGVADLSLPALHHLCSVRKRALWASGRIGRQPAVRTRGRGDQ